MLPMLQEPAIDEPAGEVRAVATIAYAGTDTSSDILQE